MNAAVRWAVCAAALVAAGFRTSEAAPDRVPREESGDKIFRPLPMGAIELPAGRGPLTLHALTRPGRQVMERRALRLTRTGP